MDKSLTIETALAAAELFISDIKSYPATYFGRGIVIPAGGPKYLTSAWVCVKMLRFHGCNLPIQLWHLGEKEVDDNMRTLMSSLGVICVDALEIRRHIPARILNGWELKPYSILHSPFEEVLLLDADNVPVANPEFLFEASEYKQTGAIFWPDYGRLAKDRNIWFICGVAYQDEPEFESGQILVNKKQCWASLNLAMWYNEQSDFYYTHVHGDKDTYHLAFRRLHHLYSMPHFPIDSLEGTMCQHDFKGRRIFQHRNGYKWNLIGGNKRVSGFMYEDKCIEFVDELKGYLKGALCSLKWYYDPAKNEREKTFTRQLCCHKYVYRRIGLDERIMSFLPDGTIGEGAADCEACWDLRESNNEIWIDIFSSNNLTCSLKLNGNGCWTGRWLNNEKCFVEIVPECTSISNFGVDSILHLGFRGDGFKKISDLIRRAVNERDDFVIVETGCIRKRNDWHGDGGSTQILSLIAAEVGADLYTIDINPDNCSLAEKLCPNANVICGDSLLGLYNLSKLVDQIGFLYLDSYDVDWKQPHPSAFHHFKELCAASQMLKSGSIVFIDDNKHKIGKGMYIREYMKSIGAELAYDGYQIGFVLP